MLRGGAKNLKILATYALTEGKDAWAQCNERSGYHLYPDLEFIEVVDKKGERCEPGERGEIVYTALDWRGSVVVRYKTGDITKLEEGKCPFCNRTVPIISQDIERSSEYKEFRLTKVKGTLVNLNEFSEILTSHPYVREWQLVIQKERGLTYGLDELILYIAPKTGINFYRLKEELKRKIKDATEITPNKIVRVGEKELQEMLGLETELKEKRIIDKRT